MAHILITHMGSPRANDNVYELTTYNLDGQTFETPMISFGLVDILRPDHVVFLGTSGSAWSSLIAMNQGLQDEIDVFDTLEQIEKKDEVANTNLIELEKCLSENLKCHVSCRVVPYLETNPVKESARYLKTLAEVVNSGDEITLDITHGLRYHPMLALVAAQYLKVTLHASIKSILYGNHARQNSLNQSPVLQLDGMLEIMDWVIALNSFDKDGDYSIFSSLMNNDGVDPALCSEVEQAGFFERTSNTVQAKQHLTKLSKSSIGFETNPLSNLFSDALEQRTQWAKTSGRGNNEFKLAELYLERGDYLRAAIFAQEGYKSKGLVHLKHDLNNYDDRRNFSKGCDVKEFKELTALRNAMAHGIPGSNNTKVLGSQLQLETHLKKLIKALK